MGDADLHAGRRGLRLQLAELERRRDGARGVVLVRDGRAEDAVEVRALVADRQLEEVPTEPSKILCARLTNSSSFEIASSSES